MADDKKTVKVDKQRTRAKADVSTFNREKRTIEVTFATETPVRTYDWEIVGGYFKEVLSCDPSHVNLVRLKSGANVLDNHAKYGSVKDVIVGVVEDAWVIDGECRARIRFSKSPENTAIMEEVADGIITNISVGYDVFAYQLIRAAVDGELDTYKAVNWEPNEISFTTVPADYNSKVRSTEEAAHEATVEEIPATEPEAATETDPPAEDTHEESGEDADNNTDDPKPENNNNSNNEEMTEEEKKAADKAARSAERTRIAGIRSHVRTLNLPDTFADTLIDDEEVTVEMAAERALKEWGKSNPFDGKPQADPAKTESDKTRSAMANALVMRIDPRSAAAMGEENVRAAAPFAKMDLLRFAEESLIRSNIDTRGLSKREIANGALGAKIRGMHHTTDFPALLGDVVQRSLLAQYQLQERTFMPFARRATLSDFRMVTRQRLSELLGDLELIPEGGEYKDTTFSTSGESYKLAKYGRKISITWEAIMNDDLSAFDRIPQAFAAKAAKLQNNMVYGILNDNPAMGDGNALFSTQHKNYTGTGTALSEASLGAAEELFLTQKDAAGEFIRVQPKFLVVGPKNKIIAQKLTSTAYVPATQGNIQLSQFTGLTPIVDPSITDYRWFLIADPSMIDTIEYAFLDGEEELFMDQREGFDIDGVEIKARLVFAAKAMDWRGMYRNNGAAPA